MSSYTYNGAIQTFTVTQAGYYHIDVIGAAGGSGSNGSGGVGAEVSADVLLNAGAVLEIIVGGQGASGSSGGGGGGGGSFVIETNDGSMAVDIDELIAGGGGGGGYFGLGGNANVSANGGTGQGAGGGAGGAGKQAGSGGTNGGGGGGGYTGGVGATARTTGASGSVAGTGFAGGAAGTGSSGVGGYGGGGGGGLSGGGGGGGYAGGGGGSSISGGGGGGSYVISSATNVVTHTGIGTGSGSVTIAFVGPPCYVQGTQIQTSRGPVAVEHLTAGDLAITASGGKRPVVWIGHRTIDLIRHPEPMLARPVRVAAGAFPGGLPHCDLLLSRDHAVVWDGALVPVKHLVNGASIAMDTACRSVAYYHVELDTHDILLAEGLPAESYLDTGNRDMFGNAGGPIALFPDFAGQEGRAEQSCLPFADTAQAEGAWRALAEHAATQGWSLPEFAMATDAGVHLLADGRRIDPIAVQNRRYTFIVPASDSPLRIVSRSEYPTTARPWIADDRRLGVMVGELRFRSGNEHHVIAMDDPALARGWWAPERDGISLGRWTNGYAELPIQDAGVLEIEVSHTAQYLDGQPNSYPIRNAA